MCVENDKGQKQEPVEEVVIDVPDEYREPGTRLCVDIFFNNGKYASSNTVTVD